MVSSWCFSASIYFLVFIHIHHGYEHRIVDSDPSNLLVMVDSSSNHLEDAPIRHDQEYTYDTFQFGEKYAEHEPDFQSTLGRMEDDCETEVQPKKNFIENLYHQICSFSSEILRWSLDFIDNHTSRRLIFLTESRPTMSSKALLFSLLGSVFCGFSLLCLSIGFGRLKQNRNEKDTRRECQALQQNNDQIEFECASLKRKSEKLLTEMNEMEALILTSGKDVVQLRQECVRYQHDLKFMNAQCDTMRNERDDQLNIIHQYEVDMQKQIEVIRNLNAEILEYQQNLENTQNAVAHLQSDALSLEQFEKFQEIIHELQSETTQLKQDKYAQADQFQQLQEHTNQLDIDNNELTIKMKQMKDLLQQKDQTLANIRQKTRRSNSKDNDEEDDDDEYTQANGLSAETDNDPDTTDDQQQLLSTIDQDVEKANQHMRDLHSDLDEKTRRIKDIDHLLNQEKDRCRELETKLKVVLELRERDAHLHIRQLGQTDAELRKARTDTERVRILQQQLELKQQQLSDVQKVLTSEQTKFSEDCSKLQHETHEKWMEVKRLTRELDGTRKECEGLRRQITKYANSERSSQEKTMLRPLAQHMNHTGRVSSEPETNGSSPPLNQYQQGENFRPIDHERDDSGAASPAEMHRIRPPMYGLARPPFFPPPFMPPPPLPFMMPPRFPMSMGGPHGMISPIPHLMTNGSGGGSDANSFEIVDSANITPNSTSYDAHHNGSAASPTHDAEQQATTKPRKSKKSLKKRTKTSTTTVVSGPQEEV